ncbi:tryptophan synthase beta subunit-like PLP-dependent enzyme [Aspergillus alliaceus]|uniref:Tryptophan synthase beta subunit-like PLP-dependent enzyme n=1 Tax=Petromyces alliaceus TaxID=209559 RepID=A0A5N7C4P3_PETAA|nr:tryptophan synthase beta subunit-like PLP-dependent enzyme [Aspergillus alliaceus]
MPVDQCERNGETVLQAAARQRNLNRVYSIMDAGADVDAVSGVDTVILGLSDSAADHIGGTPLVRLNRPPRSVGIKAQIRAKFEVLDPVGSVKGRIAKRMVEQAELDGLSKPGDTLIEASHENTGIAIALMTAIKGCKCIIDLSEKMLLEKQQFLRALGTTGVRMPVGVPIESPGPIAYVAKRFKEETPSSWILDQYNNPENPRAHGHGTAEKIWYRTGGRVDIVTTGAGTRGTVTGAARGLKENGRNVFPVGELNEEKSEYKLECIGYDFVPADFDQTASGAWIKISDRDAFRLARRLANPYLRMHPEDTVENNTILLIFPDSLKNYPPSLHTNLA